jgi:1-pyrroline-5-carboxylate dehydrogenase
MDAVTAVPSPTNEPPLHFAPGSTERARLELRLKEMSG